MIADENRPGQAAGAVAPGDIDASKLNEKLALELLRQAQEMVKAQLAAVDALNGKLSATMGQASTLALAALGAAAIAAPRPDGSVPWLPPWAAVGLVAAALAWAASSLFALKAFASARWAVAAWRPSLLWRPDLLNQPNEAVGYLMLASSLETAITDNQHEAKRLTRALRASQALLGGAIPCGLVIATLAGTWSVSKWLIPPAMVLLTAYIIKAWWRRQAKRG